jgi:hypothetical protein
VAAGAAQAAAAAAYEALRGAVGASADAFGHALAEEHGKEVFAAVCCADRHLPGSDREKPRRDLKILLGLRLGVFPELGDPVDPDEDGPLGPL